MLVLVPGLNAERFVSSRSKDGDEFPCRMSHLRHVDSLVIAKRELVVVIHRRLVSEGLRRRREGERATASRALAEAPTSATDAGHT